MNTLKQNQPFNYNISTEPQAGRQSLFARLKKDFPGYLFYGWYRLVVSINDAVNTYLYRFILRLKKIDLSSGCRFTGRPVFARTPLSKIKIGANCRFRSDKISNLIGVNRRCIISTHSKEAEIVIGDNSGFSGVTIGAKQKIFIGNNVLVGANVIISDFDWHNIDPDKRTIECISSAPVIIHDNVFIGVNSIVWKGVTIGRNSVIGANSVVTKDIPENVIAAGNPCKIIKSISTNED
jgi:acetyltransferase-like isoleucine patch superfamily enzyme